MAGLGKKRGKTLSKLAKSCQKVVKKFKKFSKNCHISSNLVKINKKDFGKLGMILKIGYDFEIFEKEKERGVSAEKRRITKADNLTCT
jgi:hypothetical protein